ncbi:MAG TPA: alkaline phosphatase family protein [Gemmataceae bacterium]|nr:alkaline phosphatase family protein [Gemmataceae bacterium]
MSVSTRLWPRKVLLAEFNEITWRLMDPLMGKGRLPAFSAFAAEGTRGTPMATEVPPHLDPWISWMSVYTGRPREEHGVTFLEQPPETVTGPRVWEVAADHGKSLGIFGSIMSWPPRTDVKGFWVPGTFSPTPDTFPADLRPIQDLNLSHTRAHTPVAGQCKPVGGFERFRRLRKLGLRVGTAARIASYLVRSKIRPHRKWEKVSLQPVVNLDFYEKLYRHHRPDLSTFHTNHVAHYQHRYWRAFDPTPFLTQPTAEERNKYGPSIDFGYRVADRVLRRLWKLVDKDTVVVLASGLGQQPYVVEEFKDGREVVRIKSIEQIVDLCGLTGYCTPMSVMAPQWNLKVPDAARRAYAERVLSTSWYRTPETKLFYFETQGDTICFNIAQKSLRPLDLSASCGFPDANGFDCTLDDLCAVQDATPKQGYHDPAGVLLMRGPGIRKGATLDACSNLDIAPTILHLMGVPVPSYMTGRVLEEAFETGPQVSVPALVG